MKTFLWGDSFFSFPSSSPRLLLPGGRWPARGAAATPAEGWGWGAWRGWQCRRVPSPPPPRQPPGWVWSPSSGVRAVAAAGAQLCGTPNCCVSRSPRRDLSTAPRAWVLARDAEALPRVGGCEPQEVGASLPRDPHRQPHSPAPGPRTCRWEADGVRPGSAGRMRLRPRSSCAEAAFANAEGVLQRNLLSLEGPTGSDSHLGEPAGKRPSTADIGTSSLALGSPA